MTVVQPRSPTPVEKADSLLACPDCLRLRCRATGHDPHDLHPDGDAHPLWWSFRDRAGARHWAAAHPRCPTGHAPVVRGGGLDPRVLVDPVTGIGTALDLEREDGWWVATGRLANQNDRRPFVPTEVHGAATSPSAARAAALGELVERYAQETWCPSPDRLEVRARHVGLRADATTGTARLFVPIERLLTTSGTGAHTSYDAAVRHAAQEAVERDAVARSWRDRVVVGDVSVRARAVAPELRLLGARARGVRVRQYALESRCGVVVLAVSTRIGTSDTRPRVTVGAAARDTLRDAAIAATLESLLVRRELIRRLRHPGVRRLAARLASGQVEVSAPGHRGLYHAARQETVAFDHLERAARDAGPPDRPGTDWLAGLGVAAVVDITPPEIAAAGWYVVRAWADHLVDLEDPAVSARSPVPLC